MSAQRSAPPLAGPVLLVSLASIVSLVLLPGSGFASNLVDLRVGDHETHARVVLQFDGPTHHTISEGSSELIVELGADATPSRINSAPKPIKWVLIERGASGS